MQITHSEVAVRVTWLAIPQVRFQVIFGGSPAVGLGMVPEGTRRNTEPVTHVPAEQVVDDCEETGLQDQRHDCDHYSMPDLHDPVGK